MPELIPAQPTKADQKAAHRFYVDTDAEGETNGWPGITDSFLAGILHERTRAAKVAEDDGTTFGQRIATRILRGPQS